MSTEGRISVSIESLRQELAELELRIVDRLQHALNGKANAAVVEQLTSRIEQLEQSKAAREYMSHDLIDLERRVAVNEQWRWRFAGISAALVFAISMVATASWHIWG